MAKYLANVFFKDESGQWHQPGTVLELEREEAALYKARGAISAYQTQIISPPETRVASLLGRRKRNARVETNH